MVQLNRVVPGKGASDGSNNFLDSFVTLENDRGMR